MQTHQSRPHGLELDTDEDNASVVGRLHFDFRKIADLRKTFEVLVLGPKSGLVGEGDGVNQ